jgi:hypothetical protein
LSAIGYVYIIINNKMRSRISLLILAGCISLGLTSDILSAPDIKDFLAKGKDALSDLQDFNFQL